MHTIIYFFRPEWTDVYLYKSMSCLYVPVSLEAGQGRLASHSSSGGSGGGVVGWSVGWEGHLAGLDVADILHQQLVVSPDLVGGHPAADSAGDLVPAVRCVPVVHRQRLLELLVPPLRPPRRHCCACDLSSWKLESVSLLTAGYVLVWDEKKGVRRPGATYRQPAGMLAS